MNGTSAVSTTTVTTCTSSSLRTTDYLSLASALSNLAIATPPVSERTYNWINIPSFKILISKGHLDHNLTAWLSIHGWTQPEINELRDFTNQPDLFLKALATQTCIHNAKEVSLIIPSKYFSDLLYDRQNKYDFLAQLIQPEGVKELDVAPSEIKQCPLFSHFIHREERERIRARCHLNEIFSDGHLTSETQNWLKTRQWGEEDFKGLPADPNELVTTLVERALDRGDYEMVQILPQKHAEDIQTALQAAMFRDPQLIMNAENFLKCLDSGESELQKTYSHLWLYFQVSPASEAGETSTS